MCFVGTPNSSYDLVILAAGMGSRFRGIKQVQPVGPHGELIIEYSAFDALRAGFGRLVLVISKDIEADFRETIGRRLESRMDVRYVFQEMDANLHGVPVPHGRTKPWGTAHATLCARPEVRDPFAVINADDFYGAAAYRTLANHLPRSTGRRSRMRTVIYGEFNEIAESQGAPVDGYAVVESKSCKVPGRAPVPRWVFTDNMAASGLRDPMHGLFTSNDGVWVLIGEQVIGSVFSRMLAIRLMESGEFSLQCSWEPIAPQNIKKGFQK